jgi:hypothetical protein
MRTYRWPAGRQLLVAAAATAFMSIGAAQAQAFPPDPGRIYTITPKHTMTNGYNSMIKCLDVASFSYNFGGKVVQSYCRGGTNQRWGIEALGNDNLELVAGHSQQCLGVLNHSLQHAASAVQWNCDSVQNPSIVWRAEKVLTTADGIPFFRIVNVNSSKCLDVGWFSQDAGASVLQATCTGTDNQLWAFYNVSNGSLGLT